MRKREDVQRSLDARTDPQRWEALVSSIVMAAEPELERLAVQSPVVPLVAVAQWFRPLAVATLLVLIAAGSMLIATANGSSAYDSWGVAEAIAPEPVAAWLLADVVPTAEEVVLALEEGG